MATRRGGLPVSPIRTLSTDALHKLVQEKVLGRIKSADEIRSAFKLFGSSQDGISLRRFRDSLHSLGLNLSMEDAERLFARYDEDGSQRIDVYELMQNILPLDYNRRTWIETTFDAQRSKRLDRMRRFKNAREKAFQATSYPKRLRHVMKMTPDQVERLIQDKIRMLSRGATDSMKQAFMMFGRPINGITPENFKSTLERYSIPCSKETLRSLFAKYDADGSGRIDFYEFIRGVLPQDYTEQPWWIKRSRKQQQHKLRQKQRGKNGEARLHEMTEYPASMRKVGKLSVEQVEQALQDKLRSYARSSNEQYREAYRLFGRPADGIHKDEFRRTLHRIGIPATAMDCDKLFHRYDANKNG